MSVLREESGYTLLESLFQLVIAAAFLHLIILFLLFKSSAHQQLTDSRTTEWELFMVDLQTDLTSVHMIKTSGNGAVLTSYGVDEADNIEYSSVGGVIRRRIGGQGHVPLLTDVQAVQFKEEGSLLAVSVTLQDGTERERRVVIGLSE